MSAPHARTRDTRRLLYFAYSSQGGIAEYAHEQANALAALDVDVTLLCGTDFYPASRPHAYRLVQALRPVPAPRGVPTRPLRGAWAGAMLLHNFRTLASYAERGGYRHVLLDTYLEYLAPLWTPPLRRLAERGTTFGVVVHDPVRRRLRGPAWWHRRAVSAAYSFVREAFVHDPSHVAHVRATAPVSTTVIPQGIYPAPPSPRTRAETRATLGVPDDAPMLLAFGSIRNDKNLDLVIRALADVPRAHLVVAGSPISALDRPIAFYQSLAESVGVADRCRWVPGYVPHDEVSALFGAADLAMLTYSATFVSASAVANVAAAHRTPFITSSGGGWLRAVVEDYGVGLWVPPDSADAIAEGLRQWLAAPRAPDWPRFERENSWERSARLVAERLGLTPGYIETVAPTRAL